MTLKLTNVEVLNADVRDIGNKLNPFDAISARAVASPDQIWAWCRDLLSEDGRLLIQTAMSYEGYLEHAVVESHRSSGIGWINVIRRERA